MIKVDHVEVFNFEGAIRGCRNPMNSWDRSDSYYKIQDDCICNECCATAGCSFADSGEYVIGPNDLKLMQTLYKGGPVHAKYLRQIMVSMDITAPLYWWKEFDTYKVGTTANSCSTMHKIHSKEFVLDDFSHEHLDMLGTDVLKEVVKILNTYRNCYNEAKDKDYWWNMIQLLPSSYNQKRTITMNYENIMNMLNWRTDHKLDEWREFCKILRELPYVKEIRSEK